MEYATISSPIITLGNGSSKPSGSCPPAPGAAAPKAKALALAATLLLRRVARLHSAVIPLI